MNRSDRPWLIAFAVGVATWLFAQLLSMALFSRFTMTHQQFTFVMVATTLGAIAIAVATGQASSLVEESVARAEQSASRPGTAWPEHEPMMRFRNEAPGAPLWDPSPREVIAPIEGQILHRRLGIAARELITRDGEYEPLDGLDLSDRGESFQAVVHCLCGDGETAPNQWLIIVRDPEKTGDEVSTTTWDRPPVTEPSVLAAVVTFKKGTRNWMISVHELHALDAAYVAGRALAAWLKVADERDLAFAGTKATARLQSDGITWDITLDVPTTEGEAEDAYERLSELLSALRVPVQVCAYGALPDTDAGEGHEATDGRQDGTHDDK
jgi:hypothetical protein